MTTRTFALGQVIAEAHYSHEASDGTHRPFAIRLGCPVLDLSGRSWLCPYEVTGLGSKPDVRAIFGSDSLHALVLALHTIPVELAASLRAEGGRILRHGHPWLDALSACRTALEHAGYAFPPAIE